MAPGVLKSFLKSFNISRLASDPVILYHIESPPPAKFVLYTIESPTNFVLYHIESPWPQQD